MKPKLTIGDRWGRLTVSNRTEEAREVVLGGTKQDWNEYEFKYLLICDGGDYGGENCKGSFELLESKFPGKRAMRDCGCLSTGDAEQISYSIQQVLYVPHTIYRQLKSMAFHRQSTVAQTAREMIIDGFKHNGEFNTRFLPKRGVDRCQLSVSVPDLMLIKIVAFADEWEITKTQAIIALIGIGLVNNGMEIR